MSGNEASIPATPPEIVVRDRRFGRSALTRKGWLRGDLVGSAWLSALSNTFPRGEAFFIEAVKAHRDGVPPKLEREIRAFVQQEVNHSREHLAFNRAVIEAGYDVSRIDANVVRMLELARERPVILNLAATMALEHFTAMLAHLLLTDPEFLAGAEPDQAAMWRWHAIEEIEHKAVAYDTWLHATREWSRWKRWKVKALMMLVVTRTFVSHRIADTLDLLAQDGVTGWRARWKVFAYLFGKPGMLRRIFPAWLAYFLPGFHPWNHDDRALIGRWEAALDPV
jgi:predicted metal-dependent hydrolase